MVTAKFVSHYVLLNKNKLQIKKRSSGVGNSEFNTSGVWDFKLAFGQASGALGDFTHISLIVLWLLFLFYFIIFFSLLSTRAASVPDLLCNAVTQGFETSPGTESPLPGLLGTLVALTSGTNHPRAPRAALAGRKPKQTLYRSAQGRGEASEDTFSTL